MGRVLCMGTMCGYGFSVCVGYYIWVGVLGMCRVLCMGIIYG